LPFGATAPNGNPSGCCCLKFLAVARDALVAPRSTLFPSSVARPVAIGFDVRGLPARFRAAWRQSSRVLRISQRLLRPSRAEFGPAVCCCPGLAARAVG
jgi:hypothetical protein